MMTNPRLKLEVLARVPSPQRKFPAVRMKSYSQGIARSVRHRIFIPFSSVSSGIPSLNPSTTNFKDISVSTDVAKEREIKVRVDLSGARTQEIFDDVFSRLVDAAQPIPGFRRVKGGKTPDMINPRLKLEVLARVPSSQRKFPAVRMKSYSQGTARSVRHRIFIPFSTVSSGIPSLNQSTTNFKDISVSTDVAMEREIKVRVDLSGARTQEIFDDVFSRLVDAAQPIPGFRRVKGGRSKCD